MSDLLDLLDAFVVRDPAPPGFAARIAIGVGERWWIARLGATAVTTFAVEPGPVDASLHLSAEAAAAILAGEPIPAEGAHHRGDVALVAKLFRRYLGRTDPIGVRSRDE
jgi:hypothetical protein